MPMKKYKPKQIVTLLRQIEVEIANGKTTPQACRDAQITAKLTRAPGNNAAIGGLKVTAASGWFAARPSGTENIYKIYAESFLSQALLNAIVREAQAMVNRALKSA